jgi:hypothetical protein
MNIKLNNLAMPISTLAKLADKVGEIDIEGLTIPVKVVAVKSAWGRIIYTVSPVHGSGTLNVDASRISFKE